MLVKLVVVRYSTPHGGARGLAVEEVCRDEAQVCRQVPDDMSKQAWAVLRLDVMVHAEQESRTYMAMWAE